MAVPLTCRHAARRLVGCGADQMSAQQLAQVLTQGLLHGRGAGLLGQQITQVLLIRIPLECTHRLAVSIPVRVVRFTEAHAHGVGARALSNACFLHRYITKE
eukprot:914274-Pelagomonas_calceolata.AAC.3